MCKFGRDTRTIRRIVRHIFLFTSFGSLIALCPGDLGSVHREGGDHDHDVLDGLHHVPHIETLAEVDPEIQVQDEYWEQRYEELLVHSTPEIR